MMREQLKLKRRKSRKTVMILWVMSVGSVEIPEDMLKMKMMKIIGMINTFHLRKNKNEMWSP